ncbi:Subunit of condensin complex [Trichophyton interdigitale]|uniref:Subunit of condensin complex n=1 Tax=Trichophyton interdigitale TaxID=101480 RepID=A0A9P5CZU4_9EURO|nr:Subunit of condensin complex [Trichophyton interdigitale]KAF3898970.1 Subunit of condensin complex [Trichophyton interdigitale]KAG8211028.1 Subunit of condensin complex [Trichophyton interdigitale]
MPGRSSSTRPSSAASTRKSSVPPTGAPTVYIPEEPALPTTSASLRSNVVEIFADAQRAITGHRKLAIKLRKIQEVCCGLRVAKVDGKKGSRLSEIPDLAGGGLPEKELNIEICRCLIRVVPVKKTEGAADRVIKFLGTFLKAATDKDLEIYSDDDPDETRGLPETPSSRLTFTIVSTLIPLLAAKDKTVRYRTTQIISHIVNSLDSIDDELYNLIRQGLVKRIRDKEPIVRVQAVMGLGRLAGNDEEDEEGNNGDSPSALLEKLLDVLQNDTSAEVRRTLLLNLPLTPSTLPFLLERARDVDGPTRRALYTRLLPTLGDFRHLSLSMREKLLRWGMRDRDDSVRKAAGRLFYDRWIEDCASSYRTEEEEDGEKSSSPTVAALTELLERIDVVNSGVDNGIAHEAMKNFWEGRPDYRDSVTFDQKFWETLTAESAFMARSFNSFCRQEGNGKLEDLADEKIPEVTAMAFYLHKYTNVLLTRLSNPEEAEGGEEQTMEYEFIVEQLLYICLTLDYSDEVGRRKMFSLLRETLAVPNLPEEITKLTVEVLRCVCSPNAAGEGEFCSVVLEAVAEVHDTIVSEDSFVSAKSEISEDSNQPAQKDKRKSGAGRGDDEDEDSEVPFNKEEAKAKVLKEIVVNMKCLYIAQCMLQNVEGNLQDNVHLVTMLNNLVVPAVRSHEAPIRERGLECLGLCCLLDKSLAEENLGLFIHCYTKGHESLQEMALRILSDIVTTHNSLLAPVASANDPNTVTPPPFQKPLLKAFAKALKTSNLPHAQSAAVIALSKMLLTNALSPSNPSIPPSIKEFNDNSVATLLQALVLAFFNPRTRDNLTLRQALTYFFPVYCHSHIANAQNMRKIAVPAIRTVLAAVDDFYALEAEEDSDGEIDGSVGEKETKVLMSGVVGMLTEWTDDRRIIGLGGGGDPLAPASLSNNSTLRPSESLHLALAKDILQRVLGVGGFATAPREERKYLLSMLSKLHLPTPAPMPSSRASSRVPEGGPDERESLRSSIRTDNMTSQLQEDDDELPLQVKDLLDQAISAGVASDASSRNALVKAKNSILKLLAGIIKPSDMDSSTMSARPGRRERVRVKDEPIEEEDENELTAMSQASRASSVATSNISRIEEEDEGEETETEKRRSARRSESVASTAGGDDTE